MMKILSHKMKIYNFKNKKMSNIFRLKVNILYPNNQYTQSIYQRQLQMQRHEKIDGLNDVDIVDQNLVKFSCLGLYIKVALKGIPEVMAF